MLENENNGKGIPCIYIYIESNLCNLSREAGDFAAVHISGVSVTARCPQGKS